VIEAVLARLDALEGKWDESERKIQNLLADPDLSIVQMGHVAFARLNAWRGRRDVMNDAARATMARIGQHAGSIFKMVVAIESNGNELDRALWKSQVEMPLPAGIPMRQFLIKLQIMSEIALLLDQVELGLDGITRLVDLEFIDITWLDRCPLIAKIANDPRFPPLRQRVAERAANVLAAFRAVSPV
jgi:hypothetical protein